MSSERERREQQERERRERERIERERIETERREREKAIPPPPEALPGKPDVPWDDQ